MEVNGKGFTSGRVLGLDIGDVKIGLATAGVIARIPTPLKTVANDDSLIDVLSDIMQQEEIVMLVVGVPRNLNGEETPQSVKIREQGLVIANTLQKEVIFVDESLSSKRADAYLLEHRNTSATQDSIAACFILEEFIKEAPAVDK